MKLKTLKTAGGFTYLAALMLVMIMGIMLGIVGESWQMIMKREKEEELFFRGNQIRYAIERWNNPRGRPATLLNDLKDLLKDPRSLSNVRYLRRLYEDPITGKEWTIIKDPKNIKGIVGVASSSEDEPVKKANFPVISERSSGNMNERQDIYKAFEGKTKYSEWTFVYGQLTLQGTTGTPVQQRVGKP